MKESIKQEWQNMRFSIDKTPEEIQRIMEGHRRTALENLARRYRSFSIIGFVMAIVSVQWYRCPIFEDLRGAIAITFIAYFLICGIIDTIFYRMIRTIDVTEMTVSEVASRALHCRKRHLQAIAILFPLAIAIIGLMAYIGSGDKYFLIGMGAGAAVGLAIGINQLRNFLHDYRTLTRL